MAFSIQDSFYPVSMIDAIFKLRQTSRDAVARLEGRPVEKREPRFTIYLAPDNYDDTVESSDISGLLWDARRILLEDTGLRHLAHMTFGDNPAPEGEVSERMTEISEYLYWFFPTVRLQYLPNSYGATPDPSSLPH
jgi:hypothetical protein